MIILLLKQIYGSTVIKKISNKKMLTVIGKKKAISFGNFNFHVFIKWCITQKQKLH